LNEFVSNTFKCAEEQTRCLSVGRQGNWKKDGCNQSFIIIKLVEEPKHIIIVVQ